MPHIGLQDIPAFCVRIRQQVIRAAHSANTGHIASAFSMVEILAVLFSLTMRLNGPDRDRFVLSKGHGALALYGMVEDLGYLEPPLSDYMRTGSPLTAFPSFSLEPFWDFCSGSLGHGLSVAAGLAHGLRLQGHSLARVFAMLSDGDCQEGSTWEAVRFAGQHKLSNLTAIIDHNQLQAFGKVADILSLDRLNDQLAANGFMVHETDGHDPKELTAVLAECNPSGDRPHAVIAHTTKGKGVSFMENSLAWHYLPLSPEEFAAAEQELTG
jgi:transketolase